MEIVNGMKSENGNEGAIVLSPACEDSGVATSGDLGEHSFSEECEGIVCLQGPASPKEIEDENRDPRSDLV